MKAKPIRIGKSFFIHQIQFFHMKISTKKLLFIGLFSMGFTAFAQAQITIGAADMPVPTQPYNLDVVTNLLPNATPATNADWDFSAAYGNTPSVADFYPEFIQLFTDAGVDAYRLLFKNLNPDFGYNVYQEYDFNANGVDDIAADVLEQNNTLQPFTGNLSDSIFIPAQSYFAAVPKRVVKFPFTANDSWESSSRRVTNMIFNIPAFGLNYAPVQHAYTWVRKDTIVGWGKMRVYTADGPSIAYDVLMDKISEHTLDSFYLAGSPAPPALLGAFGVSQGQKTELNYRYNFYRKGSFGYLASFYYDMDATFTTPASIFIGTDDLETAPPSASNERVAYSTVLYPNPSSGSELNIQLMGADFTVSDFTILDAMGRELRNGQVENLGSTLKIRMNEALLSGHYFITLKGKNSRNVLTEAFEVIN